MVVVEIPMFIRLVVMEAKEVSVAAVVVVPQLLFPEATAEMAALAAVEEPAEMAPLPLVRVDRVQAGTAAHLPVLAVVS